MSIQEEIKRRQSDSYDPFVIKSGKLRHAELEDSFYHLDWAEESFLSGNYDKEMLRRTFDFGKIKYFAAFLILLFSVLIARAFFLQIVKGNYYYSMAEGNRIRTQTIEPKRGIIYDRDMKPLVRNDANFVLYLIPSELPGNDQTRDEYLRQVGSILDINNTKNADAPKITRVGNLELIPENSAFFDIKKKLEKIKLHSLESYQPLFIADNIDYQNALLLSLKTQDFPGVFIANKSRRNYSIGSGLISATSTPATTSAAFIQETPLSILSLSHILGYIGKITDKELVADKNDGYSSIDYIGKTGLEYTYEKELKGSPGEKNIEVDALGKEKKIVSQSQPQDGNNLVLSLDLDLQKNVEDAVKDELKKLNLTRASVVVQDPRNGEILALVSWPSYDNNLFSRGISQDDYTKLIDNKDRPLLNRAVSGNFPSGSTIKPVMSAAALQENVIDENTSFLSTGGLHLGQWTFPDWKAGGHGVTNVRKAIAESVNTFFYIIGGGYDKFKGLGLELIVKYFRAFGLGEQLGIDLPNEGTGFVPSAQWKKDTKGEVWYIGDTYHLSIGQGDLTTTPLQVAAYTAYFANGGKLYQPHLVKQILDKDGKLIKNIAPVVLKQDIVSAKNTEIVRSGMRQTVLAGSARSLQTLPVEAAGKTGTAQWSSTRAPQAWFTGFAPYDNPTIAITVLIEEGAEGSTAATPVAKEILNYYFTRDKIK
ncbi:MAG: penicillin-binding protein 2 [Candidatus Falkowbacteria bacterium]